MACEFSKNTKNCCICQNWGGERQISVNKNVRVNQGNQKGMCARNKRESPANYNCCPYFVKWEKLL